MTPLRPARATGALLLVVCALAACGGGNAAEPASPASPGEVTITSCGEEVTLPSPAQRMYVTGDGNLLSLVLALGAEDQIAGVTGLDDDRRALAAVHGQDVVDGLPGGAPDHPTLENAVAEDPDVVLSGWGYGFSDETNFTPAGLEQHGIGAYVLSESCRQEDGARGTIPPWEALATDLTNLGAITGRREQADAVVADIEERRRALAQAPQAQQTPTVFLFDSGTKEIFTSGSFGGPQAIIEAAGAQNATGDLEDTWTSVSWERLVTAEPDFIAFVDYPGQTFEQKVQALESNPATKDLPAVTEERYLNLPISAWTSGPLNIDAAEQLRVALERHGLVPESTIEPEHDLRP